jgi:hypothetical protein
MKNITYSLLMVLLASGLALSGCGKPADSAAQSRTAGVDISKFQQAFPSPTPEQQSDIGKAVQGMRYGMFPEVLAALDRLASDASLTEPQKKAVADMIQGVKQTMAKTPAAPPQ